MYAIGICLVIGIVLFIILHLLSVEDEVCFGVLNVSLIIGIYLGVFSPISGYEEPQLINELELAKVDGSYVQEHNCMYKYGYYQSPLIVEEEGELELVKKRTGLLDEVEIVINKYKIPNVKIYRLEAKMSKWTFAIGCTKYRYVFTVPY